MTNRQRRYYASLPKSAKLTKWERFKCWIGLHKWGQWCTIGAHPVTFAPSRRVRNCEVCGLIQHQKSRGVMWENE